MNMHVNSISNPILMFKESITFTLTTLDKKVLVVALAVFVGLAALAYHLLSQRAGAKKLTPDEKKDVAHEEGQQQEDQYTKTLLKPTSQLVSMSGFEYGGDDTRTPGIDPVFFEENVKARIAIIDALGGKEVCEKIPVVECPQLSGYLDCFTNDYDFPQGHAIVQGEDQAGRKFVLIRTENKKDPTIRVHRIFQRRRETCILPHNRSQDGSGWTFPLPNGSYIRGADNIAKVIAEIRQGTHADYSLAPQD